MKNATTAVPERITDLSNLKNLSEGSTEFEKEILSMFVKEMPESVLLLKNFCRKKDWENVRAVAHKMKPSLSIIGLSTLQADIKIIENFAKERNGLDKLPSIIDRASRMVNQAVEELTEELSRL